MGRARSEFEELSTIEFLDFKSQKPKNVRAVRSGDTIYFVDEQDNLYTSRIVRREKYSFPLSLYDTDLIKALEKIGLITKKRKDEIIDKMKDLRKKEDIIRLSKDIRSAQVRLNKLRGKE